MQSSRSRAPTSVGDGLAARFRRCSEGEASARNHTTTGGPSRDRLERSGACHGGGDSKSPVQRRSTHRRHVAGRRPRAGHRRSHPARGTRRFRLGVSGGPPRRSHLRPGQSGRGYRSAQRWINRLRQRGGPRGGGPPARQAWRSDVVGQTRPVRAGGVGRHRAGRTHRRSATAKSSGAERRWKPANAPSLHPAGSNYHKEFTNPPP